jgi:rfaE bifunctional protein nucleotidyltransferase chain/domain
MFPATMDPVTQSASSRPPCYRAKIVAFDHLIPLIAGRKGAGDKIVHAHGVFDLLHVGHIRHLKEAKQMGDVLVVTLTPDRFVNKGPHRPAFPEDLRAEALAALEVVDYVAINLWPTSVETIARIQPHIYVKGSEFVNEASDITGAIAVEADAVRQAGGRVQFTEDIAFSSSNLLNRFLSAFPPEVEIYLEKLRRRFSMDEILSWLEKCGSLRPLVVGEAILEEYVFCTGLGKSTKDPVMAVQHDGMEVYLGGSLAIANHLAGFCEEVILLTQLGDTERSEKLVRERLSRNVRPILLTKSDSPTIQKRRLLDRYSGMKLLEVYRMNEQITSGEDSRQVVLNLEDNLKSELVDLVITADYGHGMLDRASIDMLCEKSPFLALNVQCNDGNFGLNSIFKYSRADYICMAAHELAMEIRDRQIGKQEKVRHLAQRIKCPQFTITYGKDGSLHYHVTGGFHAAPSLAVKVIDRVGAGDAVLAFTSLLAKAGAPCEIVGLIGNAVGAILVSEVGNRGSLNRVTLARFLVSLLK